MTILATFIKQPAETLDYDVDYSAWLTNDTLFSLPAPVITSTTEASPTLAVDSSAIMQGAMGVKVVLEGGTAGVKYKVTVTPTTVAGLIKQAEFYVSVKDY